METTIIMGYMGDYKVYIGFGINLPINPQPSNLHKDLVLGFRV